MKVTPRVSADFDEYPELRVLMDAAIRRVVELMEIHDIIELRRSHKKGVFDHPYVKDIVTPMGIPSVPKTVDAARYSVGVALLDYLETIGVDGLFLEVTKEDAAAISTLWNPPENKPDKKPQAAPQGGGDELDPTPVEVGATEKKEAEKQESPEEKKHDPDSVPVASGIVK